VSLYRGLVALFKWMVANLTWEWAKDQAEKLARTAVFGAVVAFGVMVWSLIVNLPGPVIFVLGLATALLVTLLIVLVAWGVRWLRGTPASPARPPQGMKVATVEMIQDGYARKRMEEIKPALRELSGRLRLLAKEVASGESSAYDIGQGYESWRMDARMFCDRELCGSNARSLLLDHPGVLEKGALAFERSRIRGSLRGMKTLYRRLKPIVLQAKTPEGWGRTPESDQYLMSLAESFSRQLPVPPAEQARRLRIEIERAKAGRNTAEQIKAMQRGKDKYELVLPNGTTKVWLRDAIRELPDMEKLKIKKNLPELWAWYWECP
jgi:hypothetical protein